MELLLGQRVCTFFIFIDAAKLPSKMVVLHPTSCIWECLFHYILTNTPYDKAFSFLPMWWARNGISFMSSFILPRFSITKLKHILVRSLAMISLFPSEKKNACLFCLLIFPLGYFQFSIDFICFSFIFWFLWVNASFIPLLSFYFFPVLLGYD